MKDKYETCRAEDSYKVLGLIFRRGGCLRYPFLSKFAIEVVSVPVTTQ